MGSTAPRRALIGLLILAAISATAYFGSKLALGAYKPDYRIFVNVGETGQGVINGSDVVARGVIVGEVGKIELNDKLQAVIELVLENRYSVPRDAVFAVTGKTLLGEKQVEIRFDGQFDEGEAIADGGMVDNPDQVVEVQDVLKELDELFGAIDPNDLAVVVNDGLGAFDGEDANIARAVDQGARATDVFSRSLDDQIPNTRDLSLVAEALGPRGDDFNRLGRVIDNGALGTITENQARLRALLTSLNAFSDQFDLILEVDRTQLDRLIIEGDNVSRMLFTYRPELADLLVGLNDYTDTIGNGGLSDPGFSGLGAGFQIIVSNPLTSELCAEAPPELVPLIPLCAGAEPSDPSDPPEDGGDGEGDGGEEGLPPPPEIPIPTELLEVQTTLDTSPRQPVDAGIEGVLDGLLSFEDADPSSGGDAQ